MVGGCGSWTAGGGTLGSGPQTGDETPSGGSWSEPAPTRTPQLEEFPVLLFPQTSWLLD